MILLLHNGGHPDKRFNEYIQRACNFYASKLIKPQVLRHIVVEIKFCKHLDVLGYTTPVKRNKKGFARELQIELYPYLSGKTILETLAHEFVHVKQYVYNELDDEQTMWKGEPYDSDANDYGDYPWEIEAYGVEWGLFSNFNKKESLWNVFRDAVHPDAPITPEPLGWLHEDEFSKGKGKDLAADGEGSDSERVSSPDGEGRKKHQHGDARGGHSTLRGWLANILLRR